MKSISVRHTLELLRFISAARPRSLIHLYSHPPLKAGGWVGILLRITTMVSCDGPTMRGLPILCVMRGLVRGQQVIAFCCIPALTAASGLKNCGKELLITKRLGY